MKIVYPELNGSNEWIQTSNPVTEDIIKGFQPIKLDFDINGYNNPWGGLGNCLEHNPQEALICDTPTENRWYMCIGCQDWFPVTGFFPGPKKLYGHHRLTQVELYIRIQQSGQYIGRDKDREIDKLEI